MLLPPKLYHAASVIKTEICNTFGHYGIIADIYRWNFVVA
jgi:hypothetical protein